MLRNWIILVIILLFFTGCAQPLVPASETVEFIQPTDTSAPSESISEPNLSPEPTGTQDDTPAPIIDISKEIETHAFDINNVELSDFQGDPLPTNRGNFTAGSGACAVCHTGIEDESGKDVSIDSYWRSTMMANSARDPYWFATVRSETLDFPNISEVIEDKCATCHMPLAKVETSANDISARILDDGMINPDHNIHPLAMDGVSCTLCHQIMPDNFGEEESFSGGYMVDLVIPMGDRINYGPFPVGQRLANLMQGASGFIPLQSLHVKESALCATCHMLYTPYIDNQGQVAGEFPEQTVFLEWLNSEFASTQACQNCHMPAAEGNVPISNIGGKPKEPFMQHYFVGGNAYVIQILGKYGDELNVTASSDQFNDTLFRISDQLTNRTARVKIEEAQLIDSKIKVEVLVENQVGHKFPTGFPSRRAWLHFSLTDAKGNVLFDSGSFDQAGEIIGNLNDLDPSQYEHHYEIIDDPTQVQIYEAILFDVDTEVTTTLLRGAGYSKDNRLLPLGFDPEFSQEDIEVNGDATQDANFIGGSDKVSYVVNQGDGDMPYTVKVELLYQSIGYRWAQNLEKYNATELERFLDYYQSVPNLPVVVAQDEVVIEEQP